MQIFLNGPILVIPAFPWTSCWRWIGPNAGGCASWYLDANGRNTTLWPTFTFTFHQEMWRCDLSEYDVAPRVDRA